MKKPTFRPDRQRLDEGSEQMKLAGRQQTAGDAIGEDDPAIMDIRHDQSIANPVERIAGEGT
ncbi:hypothetical protein [Thiorhodococcus fuscus]|uniref:Uncharacterized protein n=1 Tax=Thiorhodococcus fuscus TaxID=527200 RepID=A0ABW4Y4T4_9GAMM